VYAFTRSLDDVELLVVANFSSDSVQVDRDAALDLDDWADAEVLLDNVEPGGAAFTGRLEPWQALVLRRTQG
jgi:oligo-1,6-glucosidase